MRDTTQLFPALSSPNTSTLSSGDDGRCSLRKIFLYNFGIMFFLSEYQLTNYYDLE